MVKTTENGVTYVIGTEIKDFYMQFRYEEDKAIDYIFETIDYIGKQYYDKALKHSSTHYSIHFKINSDEEYKALTKKLDEYARKTIGFGKYMIVAKYI